MLNKLKIGQHIKVLAKVNVKKIVNVLSNDIVKKAKAAGIKFTEDENDKSVMFEFSNKKDAETVYRKLDKKLPEASIVSVDGDTIHVTFEYFDEE
jgi:hypothetical protein